MKYLGYGTICMSWIPKNATEAFPVVSLNFKKRGPVIFSALKVRDTIMMNRNNIYSHI